MLLEQHLTSTSTNMPLSIDVNINGLAFIHEDKLMSTSTYLPLSMKIIDVNINGLVFIHEGN